MIYYILGFFLFLMPLFVWQGWSDGIRVPKEFLSILGLMVVIAMSMRSRLKPFKYTWLLLLWLWCFLTTLFSNYLLPVYLSKAVIETPSTMFAWKELFYITIAVMSIWCISSITTEEKKISFTGCEINLKSEPLSYYIRMFAGIINFAVIITSIYALYQYIGLDEFFRVSNTATGWMAVHPLATAGNPGATNDRIVATLGNPKIFATWLAMCLPMCLYLRNKMGYIGFVLGFAFVLITKSSTALLGLSVATFIYLFFTNRKILLILILIIATLVSIYSCKHSIQFKDYFSPRGRIEIHKEAFNILKEKSITGLGLGTFEYLVGTNPDIVLRMKNNNWKELHDEYGQIGFTTGIVGLILFLGFIISVVSKFLNNVNNESIVLMSCMGAYFVMCLTYFLMRVAPQSFYGIAFTGLLLNAIGEKK